MFTRCSMYCAPHASLAQATVDEPIAKIERDKCQMGTDLWEANNCCLN